MGTVTTKRRWWQFSLRSMLIWSVVFSLLFGWSRPWKCRTWHSKGNADRIDGISIEPFLWPPKLELSKITRPNGEFALTFYLLDSKSISWERVKAERK